jgi:hypothetical protein
VESVDEDPVESFRGQYLNIWAPPMARLLGRDEPLVAEEVWAGLADVLAQAGPGPLVVAVEDYFGLGAAVGVAAWEADGSRVLVWGGTFPARAAAVLWAVQVAESRRGSAALCGASLASWASTAVDTGNVVFDAVGLAQTRTALPALRDLMAERRLCHDGGVALAGQATTMLVVPGAAGLSLSPRCPRSDLVRAVAWAAQRLVEAGSVQEFRVL